MTRRARVLLDASVLLAAAGSPGGGSSAALGLLAGSEQYESVVSGEVLREALGNLRLKFGPDAVLRFYTLLDELRPTLVEPSVAASAQDLPDSVAPKDRHVLQACLSAGASACLTLDRRHLLTDEIRRWGMQRQVRLLTPGEFLAWERLRTGPEAPGE